MPYRRLITISLLLLRPCHVVNAFNSPSIVRRPHHPDRSTITHFKHDRIPQIPVHNFGLGHSQGHGRRIGSQSSSMQLGLVTEAISMMPLAASETVIKAIEASTLSVLGHDILTFLFVTVITIPLSRTVGVNPTLLFLLFGCLLGPYSLHIFSNNEADLQLGDFGILFLLFNEGLGLSPDRIKDLRAFSNLGLFQIMSSMALFFFGTLICGPYILSALTPVIPLDDSLLRPILSSPVQAFCIASAGALSSSAFVLPVLKGKKWEDRPEGIAGLSILLLQDLAVAPLLVLLPVLAGSGPQTIAEFGTLIVKAVFGFGGVLVIGQYLLKYVFDIVSSAKSTETFVAATLLVAVGMGQTADFLGLSPSTGAFAAGVLLAGNRFRPQIQADIKPFEGILLGVFFITAGAELDPVVVLRDWPTLLVGIAAFLVTKAAVLFASGPALGLTRAESARVAFTLSGGGEFSFVLFKLAQELGVLPGALNKLLTASVIISMSLTPLLGEVGDYVGNYLEETDKNPWDKLTASEGEQLFDEIDIDKSGSIDLEELRVPLVKLNLPLSTIAEIFTAFDTNGDNEISREEWLAGINAGVLEKALRNSPKGDASSGISFSDDAIVICGFGNMGRAVYGMLVESGAKEGEVVAFSLDSARVTAGVLSGATVVFGDGGRLELFKAAGVVRPKAVLITYASQARRMNVLERLRQTLPKETPIYARADNQRESQELLNAGASEVISETTEAVIRFGTLLDICPSPVKSTDFRKFMLTESNFTNGKSKRDPVPGYSETALGDLQEEVGLSRRDIYKLYEIYASLGGFNDGDVSITELRDFLMRNTDHEPIDGDALTRCMEVVDRDGEGDLTFEEFVRISCLKQVLD